MAKRNRRLRGKPNWVIASLAGVVGWAITSLVALFVFEATITGALFWGLAIFLIIAAPVLLIESVAAGMALGLEAAFGAIAFVVVAPLAQLGSCG